MKDYSKYIYIDKNIFIKKYKIKDYSIIITYANNSTKKIRYTNKDKLKINKLMLDQYNYAIKNNIKSIIIKYLKYEFMSLVLLLFNFNMLININFLFLLLFNIYQIHKDIITYYDLTKIETYLNIINMNIETIINENNELTKDLKSKMFLNTYNNINKRLKNKDYILDINNIDKISLFELKNILNYINKTIHLNEYSSLDIIDEAENIIINYKKKKYDS